MPKPGYLSFTLASWEVDLLKEIGTPGDSPQNTIKNILVKKVGKTEAKKRLEQWRRKFGYTG